MKLFTSKKAMAVLGAITAATLSGGVAVAVTAYNWNTTASTPSGSHATATAQTETFSVVGTVDGTTRNLYPAGPGADIATTISNPNPYGLAVTNAVVNGSITADSAHVTAGCDASAAHYAYASTLTVASGTVATPTTASGSVGTLTLDTTTANACQGATFTVPLTVTATQNSAS